MFPENYDTSPLTDLTPQQEEELITKIAKQIVKYGFEGPSQIVLELLKPVSYITGATTMWMGAPFLEFFGIRGFDYSKLLMKRENLTKLIQKIEELQEQKAREVRENSSKGKDKRKQTRFSRLKSFFKS